MKQLRVNEIFGPTFQGEGANAGQQAVFLRLSGCNLNCSWCDTPYTWDWTRYDREAETHPMSFAGIAAQLHDHGLDGTRRLIVTGGEPLLQQDGLVDLIADLYVQKLIPDFAMIEFETNGTILPKHQLFTYCQFNVSPKLANSGIPQQRRFKPTVLEGFLGFPAVFKFVVCEPDDLVELQALVESVGIPAHRVWVMPEGTSADVQTDRLQQLADDVLTRGYNLTSRMQVVAWGGTRGR